MCRSRLQRLALALCLSLGSLYLAVVRPSFAADPVLVGAGDIADCGGAQDEATAKLLDSIEGTVFTAGDNAYDSGTATQFRDCYGPTWGRHKARTRPAPGNHEYYTSGAAPYYSYFGDNAGPAGQGYYSYDLGAWHIVSLNSEIDAGATSAQAQWLRDDLAAHPTTCTLAYWHKPVFSSGEHGNLSQMQAIWQILMQAGADVVVNGHDHNYERFAPQDANGKATPNGIRELVAGTGGRSLRGFGSTKPNSEVRNSSSFGVLRLTLHASSYDWEFIPIAGQSFRDSGSAACVGTTSAPTATVVPTAPPSGASQVLATVETAPVPHGGDAADDAAIWVDPADPSRSTIIGTDKQGGLAVYDLVGQQIQYLADGTPNNVDIRPGFSLGGQQVDLVTAGKTNNNTIGIYKVDPATRRLVSVAARTITTESTYGSCMYHSAKNGAFYYFVNSRSGGVEQWELFDNGAGKVDARKVRTFDVGTQTEGCVADDALGYFYIGEEDVGIWKYSAEPDAGTARTLVDKTGSGGHLVADIEGLALADTGGGTGYLIASSQGNNAFVLYRREGDNAFVKTFKIVADSGVDGAEGTDGIDVTTASLGPSFPSGLFVAQDGRNSGGNQNFKLVPLERIVEFAIPTPTPSIAPVPTEPITPTETITATDAPMMTPTETISPTTPPANSSTPFTAIFGPRADAFVSQDSPGSASSASSQLLAVSGSAEKRSFICFTVEGLPADVQVTSAKLRLTVVNDSTAGGEVYSLSNTGWSESITWRTQPAIDGPQLAVLGPVALNSVVEIDVSAVVKGNGDYSFAIVSPVGSQNTVGYASRNNSVPARWPKLLIDGQTPNALPPDSLPAAPPPEPLAALPESGSPTVPAPEIALPPAPPTDLPSDDPNQGGIRRLLGS